VAQIKKGLVGLLDLGPTNDLYIMEGKCFFYSVLLINDIVKNSIEN
jgi:hypothetical protein